MWKFAENFIYFARWTHNFGLLLTFQTKIYVWFHDAPALNTNLANIMKGKKRRNKPIFHSKPYYQAYEYQFTERGAHKHQDIWKQKDMVAKFVRWIISMCVMLRNFAFEVKSDDVFHNARPPTKEHFVDGNTYNVSFDIIQRQNSNVDLLLWWEKRTSSMDFYIEIPWYEPIYTFALRKTAKIALSWRRKNVDMLS